MRAVILHLMGGILMLARASVTLTSLWMRPISSAKTWSLKSPSNIKFKMISNPILAILLTT